MKKITITTPDSGDSACVNPLKGSAVFQDDLIAPVVPPPRDSDADSITERLGLPPGVEDVELDIRSGERTLDKGCQTLTPRPRQRSKVKP
jgi:hypothetical protein